eukprot:35615-Eustigmatos_ZCMA.PRE.1
MRDEDLTDLLPILAVTQCRHLHTVKLTRSTTGYLMVAYLLGVDRLPGYAGRMATQSARIYENPWATYMQKYRSQKLTHAYTSRRRHTRAH